MVEGKLAWGFIIVMSIVQTCWILSFSQSPVSITRIAGNLLGAGLAWYFVTWILETCYDWITQPKK